MQKPITVAREEFMQRIVEAANSSQLPFFIMEPIIKNLLEAVQNGARQQMEADRAAYEKHLAEQAEKEGQPTEQEG